MNQSTVLAILWMLALSQPAAGDPGGKLERIRLSSDGSAFVRGDDDRPIRLWGVNYDHDSHGEEGRLLEDYWESEWDTVRSDFQEIKDLGANAVRIHLQFGRFMIDQDQPNEASLGQLRKLIALAEECGLYLDVTGLGCYHKSDTPGWYDKLTESDRWGTQARFWEAIARTCRHSAAVFCYNLMNEPIIDGRTDQGWLAGELGGKHFVQRLTLDNAGRTPLEIAAAWVQRLTRAIRSVDQDHLITVGVIPWSHVWPEAKPVFYAPEARESLDFVSIHLYPKAGEIDRALEAMNAYQIGKPLVIEEVFPLACPIDELTTFLQRSKSQTAGHFSFYWGRTIDECRAAAPDDLKSALVGAWLTRFRELAPSLREP